MKRWVERFGGYLHAGPDGNLLVDDDAQALGMSPGSLEFFDKAFTALRSRKTNRGFGCSGDGAAGGSLLVYELSVARGQDAERYRSSCFCLLP
jgi:hypothetical protein